MSLQDYDFGVNLSQIDDDDGFKPVQPGEYQIQASKIQLKDTKLGNGKYLLFEFVITEGQYATRKIFQNVIVEHSNEEARKISLQWIKSWLMACNGQGHEQLTLSLLNRFLGQICMATLGIEQGTSGFQDKNKIIRFKNINNTHCGNGIPF